ncbi:MAG: hypothetical protein Q9160_003567 [Pyrenula sp. 1 TL-2023]
MDPSTEKTSDLGTPCLTEAAEFNRKIYKRIQRKLEADPETDLSAILPSEYSSRLAARLSDTNATPVPSPAQLIPQSSSAETPTRLRGEEEELDIPSGLTKDLEQLLECEAQHPNGAYSQEKVLGGIHKAIQNGQVLWQSKASSNNKVIKCGDHIAMKIIPEILDTTEFTGLQYVNANFPDVPAPRPLGVISCGNYSYLFTSYVQGVSLDTIWSTLDERQKGHISAELDNILEKLRHQSFPTGTSLGGVGGEGCRDARRYVRASQVPITSVSDFIAWLLSNPRFGGAVYVEVLRRLWQAQDTSIVFTHGDFQHCNIMVEERGDGVYRVTGLIDWERSGFYPDWYECLKATHNLSPTESKDDWSLFLPSCISPQQHNVCWLLDRVWDRHAA